MQAKVKATAFSCDGDYLCETGCLLMEKWGNSTTRDAGAVS